MKKKTQSKTTGKTKAAKPRRSPSQKPCIDLEAYVSRAEKSSKAFIAKVGEAIITLPRIKEPTQEKADKVAYALLDKMMETFVDAQVDAIKLAVANICSDLGMDRSIYPLTEK